ncbi:MAG: hypothetical protein B7X06_00635 [Verrucomicrobia bacterium 21-51-4]|nr:MAG: hypothetical protein B7X06_00635 [Verrucomicrobia bacterium 21-51-4]HQU08625.1 TIGR00282 family metallophosphoesterase [Opitutales bacterium]
MPRVLFIGDIVGRPGRQLVINQLKHWREQHRLDFVVANGENAAAGFGLTKPLAEELLAAGIDGLTLGNHAWDQRGFEKDIETLPLVCRPANLPEDAPGAYYLILEKSGYRLAVFTLIGQVWMDMAISRPPAELGDALLDQLRGRADAFLIEIHAESTGEKASLGWYFDGRAALVVGTHTHILTADGHILPQGTAYLTDAGITGVYDSVLGFDPANVIAKFKDGLPRRLEVAEGDAILQGCIVDIDSKTGLASAFETVQWRAP